MEDKPSLKEIWEQTKLIYLEHFPPQLQGTSSMFQKKKDVKCKEAPQKKIDVTINKLQEFQQHVAALKPNLAKAHGNVDTTAIDQQLSKLDTALRLVHRQKVQFEVAKRVEEEVLKRMELVDLVFSADQEAQKSAKASAESLGSFPSTSRSVDSILLGSPRKSQKGSPPSKHKRKSSFGSTSKSALANTGSSVPYLLDPGLDPLVSRRRQPLKSEPKLALKKPRNDKRSSGSNKQKKKKTNEQLFKALLDKVKDSKDGDDGGGGGGDGEGGKDTSKTKAGKGKTKVKGKGRKGKRKAKRRLSASGSAIERSATASSLAYSSRAFSRIPAVFLKPFSPHCSCVRDDASLTDRGAALESEAANQTTNTDTEGATTTTTRHLEGDNTETKPKGADDNKLGNTAKKNKTASPEDQFYQSDRELVPWPSHTFSLEHITDRDWEDFFLKAAADPLVAHRALVHQATGTKEELLGQNESTPETSSDTLSHTTADDSTLHQLHQSTPSEPVAPHTGRWIDPLAVASLSSGSKQEAKGSAAEGVHKTKNVVRFEVLGTGGGSSTVYKCKLGAFVCALKVVTAASLSRQGQERILEEIEILRQLRHPSIVQYIGQEYDRELKHLCMYMELCGWSLADELNYRREKRQNVKPGKDEGGHCNGKAEELEPPLFSFEEVFLVIKRVAQGLKRLHTLGGNRGFRVIHRDIKSKNVLVESLSPGSTLLTAKLCDFGVSKVHSEPSQVIVGQEEAVGTTRWMAPEVLRTLEGQPGSFDEKCDVWSLGMTLYEMLALRFPYSETHLFKVKARIIAGHLPSLPLDLPASLRPFEKILLGCIRYDPTKRFSANDILSELDSIKS